MLKIQEEEGGEWKNIVYLVVSKDDDEDQDVLEGRRSCEASERSHIASLARICCEITGRQEH